MLFRLECKKIVRSLTYILYCVVVIGMFATQYFSDCSEREAPPSPDKSDYGFKISGDQELTMTAATESLICEFWANRYVCYPFGFYKSVHLKNKKQEKIGKYIYELTGLDSDELLEVKGRANEYSVVEGSHEYTEYEVEDIPISPELTYDSFKRIMEEVDDILGGGSSYAPASLVYNFSRVPKTYEDALNDYNDLFEKDRISRGYARYFSDYSGLVLAIMPVFAAAALTAADRRKRINQLIYSKRVSSMRLVFTRFSALVFTMFIPVLMTMTAAFLQLLSVYRGENIDMAAMFTIPALWLLPDIMAAAAVEMLFTEVFSAGFAIIVQFIWWFLDILMSSSQLYGNIGRFNLVCRHNTILCRDEFTANTDVFVFNRIFFMTAAVAAAALTAVVLELKRGGKFYGIRLFGKGGLPGRKA